MVHYYWDFTQGPLKELDPLVRSELAVLLRDKMKIPISDHVGGFENPYIEILSNDPIQGNHLAWKDGMIPRAGFIQRVAIRHLTHQSDEYVMKGKSLGDNFLQGHLEKIKKAKAGGT